MILPIIVRATLGVVAVGLRRYIDWLIALKRFILCVLTFPPSRLLFNRYLAMFGWTLAVWISFQPLINSRQASDASSSSKSVLDLAAKLLFAIYICAGVLLFEKFSIQWIATKFHEESYAGMCVLTSPRRSSWTHSFHRAYSSSKVRCQRHYDALQALTQHHGAR